MKDKITDLNIKKVVSKDKNFKEYKITYKYKGKPISDYRVFDKDRPDQELKDLVTKEINKDLESGGLIKYAHKFTGFTTRITASICSLVVVGAGVGIATPLIIQANIVVIPDITFKLDSAYSNEITISNNKAEYKKDFTTDFIVDFDTSYVELPTSLTSVKVGDNELDGANYTYTFTDENHVSLTIPGNYVTDNIEVKMEPYNPLYEPLTIENKGTKSVQINYTVSIIALEETLEPIQLEYSVNGETPTSITVQMNTESSLTLCDIPAGGHVSFKGTNLNNFSYQYTGYGSSLFKFYLPYPALTDNLILRGNIMSLLNAEDFASETDLSQRNYGCFASLFSSLGLAVKDASKLCLPATKISAYCYANMFNNANKIKKAPKMLPATDVRGHSYDQMFNGCSSLIVPPKINATSLIDYSCHAMFYNCALDITEEPSEGKLFFTCPSTIPSEAVSDMLPGVTVQADHSYYYKLPN